MRVFVSHAGEDGEACSQLLKELGRQEVSYFDYSKPYEEPEVGTGLDIRMHEEIAGSDLVVVLVSKHSTNPRKTIVLGEIHDALEQGFLDRGRLIAVQFRDRDYRPPYWRRISAQSLRVKLARSSDRTLAALLDGGEDLTMRAVPLKSGGGVSAWHYGGDLFFSMEDWDKIKEEVDRFLVNLLEADSSRTWFGPFSRLQSRAWAHIDDVKRADFSYISKLVCNRLGQSFKPPAPADVRLPLFMKMREELDGQPQFVRQGALLFVDEFFDYAALGDWEEAIVTLRALRGTLEKAGRTAYFPGVVEGLCHFRLGRHEQAERAFRAAAESGEQKVDENVKGGLAKIQFARAGSEPDPGVRAGLYEEALRLSSEAVTMILQRQDPSDEGPNARMERLVMAAQVMEDGEAMSRATEALTGWLEQAWEDAEYLPSFEPDERQFEDRLKWMHLAAMLKVLRGQVEDGYSLLCSSLDEALGELELSLSSLIDFPHELGNLFLAELADVGIVLDGVVPGKLAARARGEADDFVMMDDAVRGFRFVRIGDAGEAKTRFRVYSLDATVMLRCFELRAQLDGEVTAENVEVLEGRAGRLRNPDLIRQVMVAWAELGRPERAGLVLDSVEPSVLLEHPQLLIDKEEFRQARGTADGEEPPLRSFRKLCARHFQSPVGGSEYSTLDLLRLLGQALELEGDAAGGAAILRLVEDVERVRNEL